ncbi:NUDIX domain-containing protein [Streptomyces sp. NPDC007074]|uniref:NUDIX domain-containing protein n=1 Tax=Streptomyces sp. NPDC007074 TaxID=3156764 RepID=UPI0033E0791B
MDVHLILRRETGLGAEVLLSRRAGEVYAAGLWHLPSGHLDGPHEDIVTALLREAREETSVVIDPVDVRAAVTVHHRAPGGSSRTGFFFEVRRWQGTPRIAEPNVCDAMKWTLLDSLPAQMVAYCRAGLDAYTAGAHLAVHFQLPSDTIVFDPEADRLRLIPDVLPTSAPRRPHAAVAAVTAPSSPPPGTGHTEHLALETAAARVAMVDQLEEQGALQAGAVRDALLVLPREVLMPQAYVRRSAPDEKPPRWDLLDWTDPEDRPELLTLLYQGGSVLIQHDGEPLLDRTRGSRTGAAMTSMSTVMGLTATLLQELDLRPGHRVLDVGTGAGVTAAVACHICGDRQVVTLDRDQHLADAAAVRLASLGFRPQVKCGPGENGCPGRLFDRIFVSYTGGHVPPALVNQLAPGGRMLAHVTTASPSWPALAVIERTTDGQVQSELRAVEFAHRAGHGTPRILLTDKFRQRIATAPGTRIQQSMLPPPADTDRGLWLAADHLLGGRLVRDFSADHLAIGAPDCGSWLRIEQTEHHRWSVTTHGPRDLWKEIQDLAALWRAAGSPDRYRLALNADGSQQAASQDGLLSWHLPVPRPPDERSTS